ncbi:MAG: PAS domain S-box protein [Fibrobacter sp.]|jgi:PAS domain S-box-containing protein|nr:PAS domain S-box protein [Fibrobacter sp.]
MKTLNTQNEKTAFCEVNEHGRLLRANQNFCKFFGFEEKEVQWHYIKDLYRHHKDWDTYQNTPQDESANIHFVTRLKNRKGRSFKCSISRDVVQNKNGEMIYQNRIQKLTNSIKESVSVTPTGKQASILQLSKCDICGMQLKSIVKKQRIHLPSYCPACAESVLNENYTRKEVAL